MKQKKIVEKYTDAELADSFVFRSSAGEDEKKKIAEDLALARAKAKTKAKKSSPVLLRILQLKYQIENYLEQPYNAALTFGYFLKQYVSILNIKRYEFAQSISVDETYLSQIINHHRAPNDELIIRLELHSKNLISALLWYKLLEKEKENEINTNDALRKREKKFIKSTVELR